MVNNNDIKEKLGKLLATIFQFDIEDLDFGIYKILNFKKKEIAEFINKDLIEEINKQLKLVGSEEQKKQQAELEKLKNQLIDWGIEDYEKNPKYQEKKRQLENIKVFQELEKHIYNYIYAFFSRYYDRGDFISKRRYGKNEKYAIPYNGEETLLYWANNDQYYIKTTESFKKFSFKISGLKVNFRVVEAEENNGNIKSEENRYFIVSSERAYDFEKNELNIYFEFRALTDAEQNKYPKPNQETINEDNINVIQKALEKESKAKELFQEDGNENTPLSKNLNKYTKKNTSDYFIHKDLKGFLERELDFFIKNEVFDLSDVTQLDVEHFNRYVLEVKVLRNICNKIIDFLAQIENFQKKLWEKKKFVLKTDYVISIDRMPEEFHDEIIKNKEQVAEWKDLFGAEVKSKEDLVANNTLNGAELKKLPVDTKYFSEEFKERLLEKLTSNNNLYQVLEGMAIKSENWQALRLLFNLYKNKIKCIYLDPPYNTNTTEFLYKNDFKHSSWISMMENRIRVAKEMLRDDGIIVIAIDDAEVYHLTKLLNQIFGEDNFVGALAIESNPRGRTINKFFATSHDYCIFYAKNSKKANIYDLDLTEEQRRVFNLKDDVSEYRLLPFRRSGGLSTPDVRPNSFYPIYYDENSGKIDIEKFKGAVEIIPIDSNGVKRVWRQTQPSLMKAVERGDIIIKKINGERYAVLMKDRIKEGRKPKTIWIGAKYDASSHGTVLLQKILGERKLFTYPKSLYNVYDVLNVITKNDKNAIVLDFFAGSATTAHALMNLNQNDGGNRKFIVIEMGQYFKQVAITRIKKVAYSNEWKNGNPEDKKGRGIFILYNHLEQYEDSLENIEFSQKKLSEFSDYFVRYMLDFETRESVTFLNIDKMENPFNYKINVLEDYQQKTANVDLVETYNYLIGLEVSKFRTFNNKDDNNRKYVVVEGKRENMPVIVIWRDISKFNPEKDRDFIQKIS